jgi:hypothetical protein
MGCRDVVDPEIALGEFSPQRRERFRYQTLMCLDNIKDGVAGIYALEIVDDLANRRSSSADIKAS